MSHVEKLIGSRTDELDVEIRRRNFERQYETELSSKARPDLFVLSYPKSGRTWHRVMLGCYLANLCNQPRENAFDLNKLCAASKVKTVTYSHNGANFIDWLPPTNPLVANPVLWENRAVLLLVRDPKDVLVSSYHHARFRESTFSGSVSEFVRDPRTGIVKILTALNRWHENRRLASSFDILSFEHMHRAPAQALRFSLSLIGIAEPDDALVDETITFCSFEKMKTYEDTDYFKSERLRNGSGDTRARKVRNGRIGGFRDHLSKVDEDYIDYWITKLGDPFESWRK